MIVFVAARTDAGPVEKRSPGEEACPVLRCPSEVAFHLVSPPPLPSPRFFLCAGRGSPQLPGQGAPVHRPQRVPRAHALLLLREEATRPRRRLQQDQLLQAQGGVRRAEKGGCEIEMQNGASASYEGGPVQSTK